MRTAIQAPLSYWPQTQVKQRCPIGRPFIAFFAVDECRTRGLSLLFLIRGYPCASVATGSVFRLAPQCIHSGNLDIFEMSFETSLAGQRILILEDEFYLATDIARTMQSAGAEVVGPFLEEAAAIGAIQTGDVTLAILDLILPTGPSYATASVLMSAAVPFIFLTGYSASSIQSEFAEIPVFEKPVSIFRVVEALAMLCTRDAVKTAMPSGLHAPLPKTHNRY